MSIVVLLTLGIQIGHASFQQPEVGESVAWKVPKEVPTLVNTIVAEYVDKVNQLQRDKAERIIVTGCWVDLGSLKPGTNSEVLQCPTILISLEDGVKMPNAAIGQGDLRDDPKRDHSYQSMGSLSIKGKKYPFDMRVEYEFRENTGRNFKIKQTIQVGFRRGRSVLRSTDGDRLLILTWEPHTHERKG